MTCGSAVVHRGDKTVHIQLRGALYGKYRGTALKLTLMASQSNSMYRFVSFYGVK